MVKDEIGVIALVHGDELVDGDLKRHFKLKTTSEIAAKQESRPFCDQLCHCL
jgi:hypothetical protein